MKSAQELGITQEQKENLIKMAEYLIQKNMFGRPKLKARFDMKEFSAPNNKNPHNCGTVGCVVGHGPYALGVQKEAAECWSEYALRMFGTNSDGFTFLQRPVFSFLFSGQWRSVDNTPYGAAQRIIFFLDGGMPQVLDLYKGLVQIESLITWPLGAVKGFRRTCAELYRHINVEQELQNIRS